MTRKPEFLSELDTRSIVQGYRLLAPLRYYSAILGREIVVPDGFVTNFASVPAPARIFISGHGNDRWGATVHDYLYSIKHDRKEADKVFLEALECKGVNVIKRRVMYRGVRTGGWFFYDRG
jgi:hypothetical protein